MAGSEEYKLKAWEGFSFGAREFWKPKSVCIPHPDGSCVWYVLSFVSVRLRWTKLSISGTQPLLCCISPSNIMGEYRARNHSSAVLIRSKHA